MGNQSSKKIYGMNMFELYKYMGIWYEYARYDVPYEKGCVDAKANYSQNHDGTITILNTCFRPNSNTVKGIGKEVFLNENIGEFEVSFDLFNLFWGSYIVLYTDYNNISYVTDNDLKTFWILTRKQQYLKN